MATKQELLLPRLELPSEHREEEVEQYHSPETSPLDDKKALKTPSTSPLVEAVISLYTLTGDVDQVFDAYYSPQARFEDPLVCVAGIDDFKAQFRALRGVFRKSDVRVDSITTSQNHMILDMTVTFYARLLPDFLSTTIRAFITLQMDDQQKVVCHHDAWSLRDLVVDNVPIVSSIYDKLWRPVFGKVSSVLTNMIHDVYCQVKGEGGWKRGQGEEPDTVQSSAVADTVEGH